MGAWSPTRDRTEGEAVQKGKGGDPEFDVRGDHSTLPKQLRKTWLPNSTGGKLQQQIIKTFPTLGGRGEKLQYRGTREGARRISPWGKNLEGQCKPILMGGRGGSKHGEHVEDDETKDLVLCKAFLGGGAG